VVGAWVRGCVGAWVRGCVGGACPTGRQRKARRGKAGEPGGQATRSAQAATSAAGAAVPAAESEHTVVPGERPREGGPACSSTAVSGDEHPGPGGPAPGRGPGRDLPVRRRTQRRGAGRRRRCREGGA